MLMLGDSRITGGLCSLFFVLGPAALARAFARTRCVTVLEFKCTKTEEPRPISLPLSAIAALEEHRKVQDEFRRQYGPEYRNDLDLIFANPEGPPFKPDPISAAVLLLFHRLKLPKGASLHSLRHSHCSHLLASRVPLPAVSACHGAWADSHDSGNLLAYGSRT